jgi:DNA-binding GntR family transcriptional regulator
VQIATLVRQQIEDGTLQPGGRISITTLTRQHRVSRQTAAKGLRALAAEKRLALWPSYGYTVVDPGSQ